MNWDDLTSTPAPGDVFGPLSTTFLILCAIGLVAGLVLYTRPELVWSRHLMRVSTARRWGAILLWIFSIGILFFLVGWLQINPFSFGERIWLLITTIAAAIAIALMVVEMRFESSVLASERQAYQEAVVRGTHTRRPPRRSRNRKR